MQRVKGDVPWPSLRLEARDVEQIPVWLLQWLRPWETKAINLTVAYMLLLRTTARRMTTEMSPFFSRPAAASVCPLCLTHSCGSDKWRLLWQQWKWIVSFLKLETQSVGNESIWNLPWRQEARRRSATWHHTHTQVHICFTFFLIGPFGRKRKFLKRLFLELTSPYRHKPLSVGNWSVVKILFSTVLSPELGSPWGLKVKTLWLKKNGMIQTLTALMCQVLMLLCINKWQRPSSHVGCGGELLIYNVC